VPDETAYLVPKPLTAGKDEILLGIRPLHHQVTEAELIELRLGVARREGLLPVADGMMRHRPLRSQQPVARQTTEDESKPPLKHEPTGTSLRSRSLTASSNSEPNPE